jgi:hypothetical protein
VVSPFFYFRHLADQVALCRCKLSSPLYLNS